MKVPHYIRSETTKTALLLLFLLLVLFSPLLIGYLLLPTDHYDSLTLPFSSHYGPQRSSNVFVSDAILQFYPYKTYLREAWLSGRFAFWNPLILCGYPQYAETMATNFDPLNLLLLPFPIRLGFFVFSFAPLFIAGMGIWWLSRAYSIRPWIARLSAIAFAFNGLFFTHLFPHFIPGSFCWVPFIVLCLKNRLDGGSTSTLVAAAVATALAWLGGNLQTAVFVAIVMGIYSVAYPGSATMRKRALTLTFVGVLAFALSLFMWAPTLELFYHVSRDGAIASTSLNKAYTLAQRLLTVPMLATFLIPTVGTVANGFSLYNALGAYTIDFQASIGFFPILLAVWGGYSYRKDARFRPFIIITLTALILPIATPLYHYLYHRFFIALVFALVMLSGLTAERALSDPAVTLKRFIRLSNRLFIGIAIILALIAITTTTFWSTIEPIVTRRVVVALAHSSFADGNSIWMQQRVGNTLRAFSLSSWQLWSSLAAIGIAALGFVKLLQHERLASRLIIAGTSLQLLAFAFSWMPISDEHRYPIFPRTAVTDSLRASGSRMYVDRRLQYGHQYIFLNNTNVNYRIADIAGFESLLPRSIYLLFAQSLRDSLPSHALLNALNVGYIITGSWSDLHDTNLAFSRLEGLSLTRNLSVLPRAWLAKRYVIANDSEIARTLLSSSYSPTTALISAEDAHAIRLDSLVEGQVTMIQDSPEELAFKVRSSAASLMINSDTYYPGWIASIDGRPTRILRANYAMRAVAVPAGEHVVRMRFQPLSWQIGRYGSIVALLLALTILLKDCFSRKKRVVREPGMS